MPKPVSKSLSSAREALANRIDFAAAIASLSPKDRVNAERRVSVLETEPDPHRAPLWRRLFSLLMSFAPFAKLVGKQTVQFYIPDGKYRMQVFALEDLQDGVMTIYCPNVLEEAIKLGVIGPAEPEAESVHPVGASGEPLRIEPLDKTSINSSVHFKDMVGWNRTAVRISLPPSPSPAQVDAAELLCAIAAGHFVRPVATTPDNSAAAARKPQSS